MDRTTTNSRSKLELSDNGGFKFAITLITACISVLFIIHNYAEKNLIPFLSSDYIILSALVTLSIILLLYIGSYILFKGISLEAKYSETKEKYESLAKDFYVDAFKVVFYFIFAILIDQLLRLPFNSGFLFLSIAFSYIIIFRPEVLKPELNQKGIESAPQLPKFLLPILKFKSLIVERYVAFKHKPSTYLSLITEFKPLIIKFKSRFMKFKSLVIEKYEESKSQPLTIGLLIFNLFILILVILITAQIYHTTWTWANWILNSPLFVPLCVIILFFYTIVAKRFVALKPTTIKLLIFNFSVFIVKLLLMIQMTLVMWEIGEIYSHVNLYSLIIDVLFLVPLFSYISKFEILKPLELVYFFESKYFLFFLTIGSIVLVLILPSILYGHLIAEMNSIYYKQDKQIPVDISVTGFRNNSSGVFLDLYRIDSKNLTQLDSLNMLYNSSVSEGFSNINQSTYLYCNNVGLGRYKTLIDCSKLREGHYELSIIYGNSYGNRDEESSITDRFYHDNERINNSFYLTD